MLILLRELWKCSLGCNGLLLFYHLNKKLKKRMIDFMCNLRKNQFNRYNLAQIILNNQNLI